jgi:hypothetical protein
MSCAACGPADFSISAGVFFDSHGARGSISYSTPELDADPAMCPPSKEVPPRQDGAVLPLLAASQLLPAECDESPLGRGCTSACIASFWTLDSSDPSPSPRIEFDWGADSSVAVFDNLLAPRSCTVLASGGATDAITLSWSPATDEAQTVTLVFESANGGITAMQDFAVENGLGSWDAGVGQFQLAFPKPLSPIDGTLSVSFQGHASVRTCAGASSCSGSVSATVSCGAFVLRP